MSKEDINFNYKKLHPFKWYILQNYPFLEDSIDVLTNYQLFCKLGEMYNKQVDAINTLGIQVETLTDWFDDLDVQEEIDNKLDEMAESGELEEIIGAYLNSKAIFGFDNVSEMKNATNLIDGSYAKTLGYHSKNDGGSALYKIRNITNDDVIDERFIIEMNDPENQLIAELIYGDEIKVEQVGAYGDGTHDDTSSIQAAINKNLKTILDKKYMISSSLIVDVGFNKGISGTGTVINNSDSNNQYATFLLNNSLTSSDITPDAYYDSSRFKLSGLTLTLINGDNYTDSTHYGVGVEFASNCNRITVENCIIKNLYYGILSRHASVGIYLNKIKNCSIYSNEYNIWLSATTNSGENITFDNCQIFGAKIGNRIENDMYVNFVNCSIDYNHDYIFYIMGGSNVTCTNCHIEWKNPNRAFNLYDKCRLKFIGCSIIHALTDTCDYMIYCNNTYPYVLFDSCSFMSSSTYTNLVNNDAFVEFVNCDRYETSPLAYTNPHNTVNYISSQNIKLPLGYVDTKLTFSPNQCIVTASEQSNHNRIYLPFNYNNRDGKLIIKVDSNSDLTFDYSYGDTHFLGDAQDGLYGVTTVTNQTLTSGTTKTIEIDFKRRKGFDTTFYIMFNLSNLSAGKYFRIRETNIQLI